MAAVLLLKLPQFSYMCCFILLYGLDNVLRLTVLCTLPKSWKTFCQNDSCDLGKLPSAAKCDTSFSSISRGMWYFASLHRSKFDTILLCLSVSSAATT